MKSGRSPSGSDTMVSYGPDHPDYPNAPSDWDGGPYLCRDGQLYHMRGYGWGHGLGCWNDTADWDRIAYRAEPATGDESAARDSEDAQAPDGLC